MYSYMYSQILWKIIYFQLMYVHVCYSIFILCESIYDIHSLEMKNWKYDL